MNICCRVGFEILAAFGVPVQIEFAVDDFKHLRIYTGNLAGRRQAPRSVSAILRRISYRIGGEKISIFRTCEIPFGIVPFVGVLSLPLYRAAFGMIGDGVVAFDGDAKKCRIYLVQGGYGTWQ